MILFDTAKTEADLQQILTLQSTNHPSNINAQEMREQGFVTVKHSLPLLEAMNKPYPHIVARDNNNMVIAYALVMLKPFAQQIPVLIPMFEKINTLVYKGNILEQADYFVMGQICISKAFRGQGIFPGLYQNMKMQMHNHFKYVITEVATRNFRSIRAHKKAGFNTLHEYTDSTEKWNIMLWDWQ